MNLLQPFRQRHRLVVALAGLLFGSSVGMAYIGRGRLSIAYFVSEFAFLAGGFAMLLWSQRWDLAYLVPAAMIGARLLGIVHAMYLTEPTREPASYPAYSRWYAILGLYFIAPLTVIGLLSFRSLIAQPFRNSSAAMLPTFNLNEYMVASKSAHGIDRYSFPFFASLPDFKLFWAHPQRGDTIVFALPSDPTVTYFKRVIGLPGDTVQVTKNVTYINGKPMQRTELAPFEPPSRLDEEYRAVPVFRETLPDGRQFDVLEMTSEGEGDNTELFRVPEGHYFVMGDNRDNSNDSRFGTGFVPEQNIQGKIVAVLFSLARKSPIESAR